MLQLWANFPSIEYPKHFYLTKIFSTAHAITNLIDSMENAIEQNEFACGIFIDFKKVFNLADQEVLFKKLWHYEIRGIGNARFKSYLRNRTQCVSIDRISYDLLKVNFGV